MYICRVVHRLQTAQMCISFCLLNLNKWIFYQEVRVVLYFGAQNHTLWLLNLDFSRIDVLQTLFIVIFLLFFINIIHAIWKT